MKKEGRTTTCSDDSLRLTLSARVERVSPLPAVWQNAVAMPCGEASPMATYREITFPRLTPPTFLLVPFLAFLFLSRSFICAGALARARASRRNSPRRQTPCRRFPIFESFAAFCGAPRRFLYRVFCPIHREGNRSLKSRLFARSTLFRILNFAGNW